MKSFKPRDWIPGWNVIEYGLLRGLAAVLNALPIEAATAIARSAGQMIFLLGRSRVRTGMNNLEKAFPGKWSDTEKKKIIAESLRNFSTSLMEFFRIPRLLGEAQDRFIFEGTEHLDRAFQRGKGLVFVISHLGSWECLGFLPYLRGYPCSVIVRAIKNPYIYKWIQHLRTLTGLRPIDKKNSVKQILSALKKNELVAILIDQWAGPEGLWLDFFNHPTSTTSIPARLAYKTGTALVPGYCLRTAPGKYKIVIRPEVPLATGDWERETTLKLNEGLEKEILLHPEQWIWTHKRWKDKSRYLRKTAVASQESH